MNVNSVTAGRIELQNERVLPDLKSLKFDPNQTIRQKIDSIVIRLTDICKFDDTCSNVTGEIEKVEFDMVGIDVAICNTFRRIMIAEVPQLAFERILMYNNTSLIQDEVLAHRLGLIPIKADFRKFIKRAESDMTSIKCTKTADVKVPKEDDTLKFTLKVCGKYDRNGDENQNERVTSGQLVWHPIGSQAESMDVKPVFDDITIAKIKPKQEIDIELHAHVGIGRDHAKFSPVCTAFYRLLPTIDFKSKFCGEEAHKMKSFFSPGVVDIRMNESGQEEAFVKNARLDANTREVYRHQEYRDLVELGRVREHALFSVETVGALPPQTIFKEACKVLESKCDAFLEEISSLQNDTKGEIKKDE